MGQPPEMLWVWIALCFLWKGTSSFMILNPVESLCLEDSLDDTGVQLKRCSVDSDLQQWVWIEHCFLMNVHTHRCLSAIHGDPVRTLDCDSEDHLQWQCMSQRLISGNRSLDLGVLRGRLALTNAGKNTRWKSMDALDICQERLRARRQSETGQRSEGKNTMTDKRREYLKWYYRTEDPTPWKFAMLAMSLVALLLGCAFCVMGLMGNKHRKQIAKYKAVAVVAPAVAKTELKELQDMTELKEQNNSYTVQMDDSHPNTTAPVEVANESDLLKPGQITVLDKDGTVENMYLEPPEEEQDEK